MKTRSALQVTADHLPTSRFTDTFPIYIYAFVSPSGVVVYVGRTWDPPTRIGAHRKTSGWWTPDLEFAVVGTCRRWSDAVMCEADAIRDLRPIANIQHNQRKSA